MSKHTQVETLEERHHRRLLCLTALVNAYKYLELDERAQIDFVQRHGYWYRLSTSPDAIKVEMIRERMNPSDTYHEYSFEIIKKSVFADDAHAIIFRGPDLTPEEMELYRKNEDAGLDFVQFPQRSEQQLSDVDQILSSQVFSKENNLNIRQTITKSVLGIAGITIQ